MEHLTLGNSIWNLLEDSLEKVSQDLLVHQEAALQIHSSLVKVHAHCVEGLEEDWIDH
jgi:hypothetical protein